MKATTMEAQAPLRTPATEAALRHQWLRSHPPSSSLSLSSFLSSYLESKYMNYFFFFLSSVLVIVFVCCGCDCFLCWVDWTVFIGIVGFGIWVMSHVIVALLEINIRYLYIVVVLILWVWFWWIMVGKAFKLLLDSGGLTFKLGADQQNIYIFKPGGPLDRGGPSWIGSWPWSNEPNCPSIFIPARKVGGLDHHHRIYKTKIK